MIRSYQGYSSSLPLDESVDEYSSPYESPTPPRSRRYLPTGYHPPSSRSRTPARGASSEVKPPIPLARSPKPYLKEADEFRSALFEYSEAVVRSTMPHASQEAQTLKDDIIDAKKKVIATHEDELNKLKTKLTSSEERNRQLNETIVIQESTRSTVESQLEKEKSISLELERVLRLERDRKERYKQLYEKRGLELKERKDECEQLQRECKKRERPEEVWEAAEGVRLRLKGEDWAR